MNIEHLLDEFKRTTHQVISPEELQKALKIGRPLNLKYGADVTSPDLHIGHAVNLWMYRSLQELGHRFIFLIGDFTTGIGDPTGRDSVRRMISTEEMNENAEKFIKQVKSIVIDDPEVFEIRRNSEWFVEKSAKDLLNLMSMVTQDRLLSRDMFRKRLEQGQPIYQHEIIYPLIQGYDSVALSADLTIVGTDQLFNEQMGRFYQEREGLTPQVIITTKITPGIDGKEKQSKSIGNYIGLSHSPRDKFGRIMTIPDELIPSYFEVYTTVPEAEIDGVRKALASDPMQCKLALAEAIVARYHGAMAAAEEREWFVSTFSNRTNPQDMPKVVLALSHLSVLDLLRKCYTAKQKSNSELRRLIQQKAVKLDGNVVSDANESVQVLPEGSVLKVGKRNWFKIVLESEK